MLISNNIFVSKNIYTYFIVLMPKKSIKIKRWKRRNTTRKQKGGTCPCSNRKILMFGGSRCISGGNCKKCGSFFSGGGNANLGYVFNNPNYVIPQNNHTNDPIMMMRSERLTGGGKKQKRNKRTLKKGGFLGSLVPMNGVTAFGDSNGVTTMKNILSGSTNNNYQPYGSNLNMPNMKIMV
jgi:hypothetical protein